MTVTKDGKTATPNEDALNTLGYIFRTVGYAGEQCDCGKKYAVIDTVDGQYSFCTCDDPKIESACGTHRIDKDSLERLKTTVDAMFE